MSSKKKRKSSCPFASANRADVLATIVIKSKIDGRTIPFVLAQVAQALWLPST